MPLRLTSVRLLALLLIGALLLCHGAFGSLHQFHGADEINLIFAEHAQHQQEHEAPDFDPPLATDYFAAFFALLFWLAYSLLRRRSVVRFAPPGASVTRRPVPAEISNLPRGPSPPLLQVFRL